MVRTRIALCVIVCAMAVGTVVLGLAAPAERRIHVRWSEAATSADRTRAEQELHLEARESREEWTWSYELLDQSTANIARLVAHPLIEDTHNIDRSRLTLAPEVPAARAWIRRMYQRQSISMISKHWQTLAPILAAIGLVLAWPHMRAVHRSDPTRVVLAGILVVSLLLRMALISSGGQFYWPDEGRYQQVRDVVVAFAAHDPAAAMKGLDEPAHLLFKTIGTVPATVEFLRGDNSRIPAFFFALFSLVNIWLIVKIARRLEAGPLASLLAGALFAASSSFFYYSRHLLPYDLGMTFGLLATYAGTAREPTWRSSVACGACAACAFLTYAGYWTLGGAACMIHVLDAPSLRDGTRRAFIAGVGLASTLGAVFLIYAALAAPLVENLVIFARTITEGSYEEGWRLPLEYLWHAEHLLFVLWLAALAWCTYRWRVWLPVRTVRAAFVGIAFVYGALVVCSVVLNVFVVYGRLARQLVPFLCLITAAALANLPTARRELRRRTLALVTAVIVIQAGFNFSAPLRQQFPREFKRTAETLAERAGVSKPVTVYTHHIDGAPEPFTMPRECSVLAEARHPLQFLPYQYEGFTPRERQALRTADIRMRLLIPGAR